MSSFRQNLLVGILVLALLVTGYFWFSRSSRRSDAIIQSRGALEGGSPRDQFVVLLAALSSLKFDTSFFQDPAFTGLVDHKSDVVVPSERGRANPFAPLR